MSLTVDLAKHPALRIALLLLGVLALPAQAAELVSIPGATLIEARINDGDSFKVNAGGRELHLRLYYVDSPETTYDSKAMLARTCEQQRYFGLDDLRTVADFGEQATEYTQQALSRPFTVHTSYAKTPGGSRCYAFIETHDGRDLGHLLVEQGLARIHGKTRPSPDGTPSKTVLEELRDLLDVAMLKRTGIWKASNPDLIPPRADDPCQCLSQIPTQNDKLMEFINTASSKELQRIRGIGPVKAGNIIAGRPYKCIEDLLKIPGIGPKTLETIVQYITIGASNLNENANGLIRHSEPTGEP